MPALFTALAALYSSAAQCAAALGISRQAYCQAAKRQRLSNAAALRAAALLKINPGKALLCNATGKDIPSPVRRSPRQLAIQMQDEKKPPEQQAETTTETATDYKLCAVDEPKKSSIIATMEKIVHVIPQSAKRLFEIDCVRWMLCVPKISPDSPRFAHYFSRWTVPDKIASSKKRGDFEETVKNCPLFAPELLDYIQAGLDEYHKFTGKKETPAFKSQINKTVKVSARAA